MKQLYLILCFFLLFTQITVGQNSFVEDFSDLDFTSNPTWYGDTSKFRVNVDSQLQLNNASITDEAILYTPLNLKDTATWVFYFNLDFNPSDNNSLIVYLASVNSINTSSFNGYLLRIGENGNDDAIELVKKKGTNEDIVIRGTEGLFANNPSGWVEVSVANGNWKLSVDTGSGQFLNQGSAVGFPLVRSNYFGIQCNHTSTRSDKFYFDDFFISPLYKDTIPPKAISVDVISSTSVSINYSELVTDTTASNEDNYSISGAGNPIVIAAVKDSTNPLRYILDLNSSLQNKEQYSLTISNISDADGNKLSSQKLNFNYFKPEIGDLVINEIFPDPNPTVALPEAEFIELYNPTDFDISLIGFKVADASDTVEITHGEIPSQSYLIICDENDESDYQPFGEVIGIPGLPALNNSGDELKLISPEDELFDKINYTSEWYQDEDKSSGGWTLERIAINPLCEGKPNWRASLNQNGGTPGTQNSIVGVAVDTIPPKLADVVIIDELTIQLKYIEPIAVMPSSISFNGNIDSVTNITMLSDPTILEMTLSNPIEQGFFYEVKIYGALDCYNNGNADTGTFIDPLPAASKDIVINEILFNPRSGGVDYLEIFNRSDKILPLNGLRILEWDPELNVLDEEVEYEGYVQYIFPGDYMTFTNDSLIVSNQYDVENPGWLIELSGFPNYPDEKGIAVIYSSDSVQLDSLSYSADWHYDLLSDENGVSLERISFESETNDVGNWFSASSTSGFGTPTYKNSQFYSEDIVPGEITVTPEVFSPDQDGYKDFLTISIQLEEAGYAATVQVFDARGRFIAEIANNELLSTESTFRWNGVDSNGDKASPGIYVVNIQMFHPNGRTLRENRKCVLAERR